MMSAGSSRKQARHLESAQPDILFQKLDFPYVVYHSVQSSANDGFAHHQEWCRPLRRRCCTVATVPQSLQRRLCTDLRPAAALRQRVMELNEVLGVAKKIGSGRKPASGPNQQ